MTEDGKAKLFILLIGIIAVVTLAALAALIFMLVWNWVVPSAFNGPEISFWLAWGILILLGFIGRRFKGK